ncbi:MAG: DNA translocase FtsK 4TM domain-containing protein, partial [Chloroflexota bacterium]|nr:DNA translocase FtsK 4TM domain-containing protein [Chloroflexota bacterium]
MSTRRASRRRSQRRRRANTTVRLSGRVAREGLALLLVFLAIVSVIALFAPHAGAIVEPWHRVLAYLLGWGIAFAPPLLAGFALMLWMKTMPSERWMAATGASLVALALLGAFQLAAGGGVRTTEPFDGGGLVGYAVSAGLVGALGAAGAWAVISLLLVVGMLLYFNMTIGDVVAAYLQQREERQQQAAGAAVASRRSAVGPGHGDAEAQLEPARAGIFGRMRGALAGGPDEEEPPLIVRRQR